MIPLSVPNINGNEWLYVKECLDTEWVSSAGKYVDQFEQKIAQYTGTKYAIACVNGTSALHISLLLAGVKPFDEVIVPTLTFIAPVNAISYNGAIPIFMDVDCYFNLDTNKTAEFIEKETIFKDGETFNKKSKKRISAIIPVHMWGNAMWLDDLVSLCAERNIAVVEDASESVGTFYSKGSFSGNHTGSLGRLGCLSFNGNKIITTGGGGMIITDDIELEKKARYLTTQAKDDPIKYIHNDIGYNYRLSNIQAALGVAQLEQLPGFLKRKKEIHQLYLEASETIEGLEIAKVPDYADNNYWMNILQISESNYGIGKEELMIKLGGKNIQIRPVWALNHLQKPYKNCQSYKIELAIELVENSLCLPSSTNLGNQEIKKVIDILNG